MNPKIKIIYVVVFLIIISIILFLYLKNKKIIAFEDCLEDCPTSGEGTVCLEKCQTKYQIDWGEYIFWKDLKSKLHQ